MIEVQGLTKFYGNFKAIEDVSFTVARGEVVGFLGPNGAGKTTTMRILTGYMPATHGTCRIEGLDVFDDPMGVKRKIGYLPENVPLYPELTVNEYLSFVGRIKNVLPGELALALDRIIAKCGLEQVRGRLIGQLSKGFRQRVGLAQALIHDPEVIVLDEPTIGLDPAQIREVRELIKGLGRDHTIILSSHILPEVSQVCDRVLIINKGRIVAEDTPENLIRSAEGNLAFECLARGTEQTVRAALESDSLFAGYALNREEGGELWRCRFSLPDGERRPAAIRLLLAAGVELYEFYSHRVSLEDVFLQLTTAEEKETASPVEEDRTDAAAAPEETGHQDETPREVQE